MTTSRELRVGDQLIGYQLRRARRRTIGFLVGADGVTVSAPRWVPMAEIEAALREKSGWIVRKLAESRERARRIEAARIDWRDGASVPFLGRRITIVLDPAAAAAVLDAGDVHLAAAAFRAGRARPASRCGAGLAAAAGAPRCSSSAAPNTRRGWACA